MSAQCDTCGRFLAFADLCFSQHHFTPLNEFGPEESTWTGPCCRYRDTDGSPKGRDAKRLDGAAATAGAEGIAKELRA